jgi:hypothetical protein
MLTLASAALMLRLLRAWDHDRENCVATPGAKPSRASQEPASAAMPTKTSVLLGFY